MLLTSKNQANHLSQIKSNALHLYLKKLYFIFGLYLLNYCKQLLCHNCLGTNQLTGYSEVGSQDRETN